VLSIIAGFAGYGDRLSNVWMHKIPMTAFAASVLEASAFKFLNQFSDFWRKLSFVLINALMLR
jgi:hypothetical protein